jgi:hypothetical protein
MKRLLAFTLVALVAGVAQAEEPKSGLKDGAFVAAFNVRDVTGPNEGKTLCYRCLYNTRPVVSIFTRNLDDATAQLIKKVDEQVGKNEDKQMRAFVVLLTDDADSAEEQLKKVAEKQGIKNVPLTVFDGEAGPPEYKINKDAEVTVLMWNKSKVEANRGFAKGEFDAKDVPVVLDDTKKILE